MRRSRVRGQERNEALAAYVGDYYSIEVLSYEKGVYWL
jgi:hypothetical protein